MLVRMFAEKRSIFREDMNLFQQMNAFDTGIICYAYFLVRSQIIMLSKNLKPLDIIGARFA